MTNPGSAPLPLGLKLSSNEILVLSCFKQDGLVCYPAVETIERKEVAIALGGLVQKQLIVRRQYWQLTKKGKGIWEILNMRPEA